MDSSGISHAEVDRRPREILERYVELVGGSITVRDPNVVDVTLPAREARLFGQADRLIVALTPDGLEVDPQAEILVNGSLLLRKLVEAIQTRGSFVYRGEVPPTLSRDEGVSSPGVELSNAATIETSLHDGFRPMGRLLAKLTIHAGPALVEKLVETDLVDFSSGSPAEPSIIEALHEGASSPPNGGSPPFTYSDAQVEALLGILTENLAAKAGDDLLKVQREAETALNSELVRLVSYYDAMIEEAEESSERQDVKDRKAAIRADRDRRKKEEEHRHTVRVSVHPIQLTQWNIPAQEVRWRLRSDRSTEAILSASRTLVGNGSWRVACPSCGGQPESIRICRHAHACCESCSAMCTTCGEACCTLHGVKSCDIVEHAVCDVHAASCRVCDRTYCDAHSGTCEKYDHDVCSFCSVTCARCEMRLCKAHSTATLPSAPLGQRWLCSDCVVFCEGGQNEPVGLDEVTRCSTCTGYICSVHLAHCSVDGEVHCSKHLRRSDRSGMTVCMSHRATCEDEPHSVLASTEVAACSTCGRIVCDLHGGTCASDKERHCASHLRPLPDEPDILLCEKHRDTCHVGSEIHRVEDLSLCSLCSRRVCRAHCKDCRHCGRAICARDVLDGLCRTCARLAADENPDERLISSALYANGGEPPGRGSWKTARDAAHTVVEINFGWSRKLVFSVPHLDSKPTTVVRHSLFGSKRGG